MAGKAKSPRNSVVVRVIHRVNQRLVTTECRSVRDSNVSGFIELTEIVRTDFNEALGPQAPTLPVESLVIPKIVVVAICYPRPEGGERVVLLHSAEPRAEAGGDDE